MRSVYFVMPKNCKKILLFENSVRWCNTKNNLFHVETFANTRESLLYVAGSSVIDDLWKILQTGTREAAPLEN